MPCINYTAPQSGQPPEPPKSAGIEGLLAIGLGVGLLYSMMKKKR